MNGEPAHLAALHLQQPHNRASRPQPHRKANQLLRTNQALRKQRRRAPASRVVAQRTPAVLCVPAAQSFPIAPAPTEDFEMAEKCPKNLNGLIEK